MNNKCFIFSSEVSRSSGGIGNTTYYLIKSFVEDRYTTIGIVDRIIDSIDGANIYETKEKSIIKRIVKGSKFFKKHRNTNDICLCLNWRYALVPFICGGNYIVMAHGNDVENASSSSIRSSLEHFIRKIIINKAIKICANSHYTSDLVKQIRKKDDPIIIHPCSGEYVDFDEEIMDDKYILSIGRLEERKGFQYAIEAFSQLIDNFPDYKYIIAGDGPYKNVLEETILSLQLEHKCILMGRVTEDKKRQLLRKCSLLVMPSFFNRSIGSVEGFGIVYIEANAHGKPVIGTRSGGIPDAIVERKTGLLVDEKNTIQLRNAMQAIISNDVQINENFCKEWADKHYYTVIAKQYIETIELIMNSRD